MNAAPLTITPTAGQSKGYGAALPALTYTASGLVNGDPATLLTGALGTTAASASAVGNYAFTLGTLAAGGNYTLALAANPPTFAVTPATLTVIANAQTKGYGSADPTLTYAVSGFQLSDTAATVLSGALTRAPGETVAGGPYAISQGTLAANTNYNITYNTGYLTITPAPTTTSVSTVLTTSLIDNGAVVPFRQPVTLTATVSANAPSTAVPTGRVDFLDETTKTKLNTSTLNAGTATFTTSTLAPGVHRIVAVYSGGGVNFAGSTATLEEISIIIPVAGNGVAGFGGDHGPASRAQLNHPEGVAADTYGNFYIADTDNNAIRKVDTHGTITTVVGPPELHPAVVADLSNPTGIAVDAQGNLYIADTANNAIRKVSPDGIINTVAGNGTAGFGGDGGLASQAQLNHPEGVAVDAQGNLYIADTDNNAIRKVDTHGTITTVVGPPELHPAVVADLSNQWATMANSRVAAKTEPHPAVVADLSNPTGIAVDAQGNLYIADTGNNAIRKVDTHGAITTIVGPSGRNPAVVATLNRPSSVAVDAQGIYITDTGDNQIIRVRFSGDGRTAPTFSVLIPQGYVSQPTGIAVIPGGGILFAGTGNNAIYQITTETAMGPGGNAVVVEGSEPNLPPPNNPQPSILLVGAQNSSLALIATLVVTSLTGVESQEMSVGSGTVSVSPTQAIAPSGEGGAGAHADDESGNPQGGLSILIPTALRPWVLVLLGTNEALARIRGTTPDLFTSGDGQQGPVELLSRAYQAVLRSIDEAIHGIVLEGHTPSLPARIEDRDIDELAGDLAREGPAQPEPARSAVPVAAGPATDPAELLPDTSKSTRFRLVNLLAVSVASIGALTFTRVFLRYRQRHLRLGVRTIPAPKPA